MAQKNLALYLHWPWCKHKCPYCDFNSHVNPNANEQEYKNAIIQELNSYKDYASDYLLTSLFFGGGTPSLMSEKTLSEILEAVNLNFKIAPNAEFSLEANPTSSEAQKFASFTSAGINRFSIGVQSLQPEDLAFLGREHSVSEALKTVEMALKYTPNVNLDLIYGLPNQNLDKWLLNLEQLLGIGVPHLSAYQLTVEKNTQLYKSVLKGEVTELDPDIQFDFYQQTCQLLEKEGLLQYEISNFAKPGYECQQNLNIWRYQPYIGVGAGAHGRIVDEKGGVFATNTYKMPQTYIDRVTESGSGIHQKRQISEQEIVEESMLMSLRLKEGINTKTLNEKLTKNFETYLDSNGYNQMIRLGFLEKQGDFLKLREKDQQLLDAVLTNCLKLSK